MARKEGVGGLGVSAVKTFLLSVAADTSSDTLNQRYFENEGREKRIRAARQ